MTDAPGANLSVWGGRLAIALGALAGAALFAYTLYAAGPADIFAGIRRIGLGFVLVLVLSGIRMAVRARAWSLCVEQNEQFTFREAFVAFVAGDALGNVSPLGPVVSESTKAVLGRRTLSTSAAVSSIVLENIFYGISVAVMVTIGTLAFLLGFRPTEGALTITIAVSAAAGLGMLAVWWVLSSRPRILSRFFTHTAVRDAEDRVFRFAQVQRDRLAQILLLEFAFHVSAVLEIYLLLALLIPDTGRTLLLALILETVDRLITIGFKFVPLRLGVDQAGSGLMATILGLGLETGVTLATIRTGRNLFWAVVGLTLLLRRNIGSKSTISSRLPRA